MAAPAFPCHHSLPAAVGTQQKRRKKQMSERVIWWGLSMLADGGIKAAAKLAPQREVDIFPHRLYAKGRKWWHLDAYRGAPGWLCIEFGGWTVDVCWKVPKVEGGAAAR
jgi:hypothetical protein